MHSKGETDQSPQLIGSYFAGLSGPVQDGRTPHFSLKLKPKKKGIEYLLVVSAHKTQRWSMETNLSTVDLLKTRCSVLLNISSDSRCM